MKTLTFNVEIYVLLFCPLGVAISYPMMTDLVTKHLQKIRLKIRIKIYLSICMITRIFCKDPS